MVIKFRNLVKRFVFFLFFFLCSHIALANTSSFPPASVPVAPGQGGIGTNTGPTNIKYVVGFGDSIVANTAGGQICDTSTSFVTPNPSGTCFLDYVGIYYGAQVANLGIGGTCNVKTTTASSACNNANSGFARYQNANTAGSPGFVGLLADPTHTLVIISYTLNDAIKGDTAITPTLFNTDLAAEVSWLENTENVPPLNHVIMGPSPIDPYGGSTPNFPGIAPLGIQDALVAYKYGTRFVDSYSILAGCFNDSPYPIDSRCDTDGIHPNASGGTKLGINIVNSTFANAIAGISSMQSLAAVLNQPVAIAQRRISSLANNQVGTVESFTGSLGIYTRGNPYENWYNAAGTSILYGPLNDSLNGISGLISEIKTSSPLFTLDGSGNGSFAGIVYAGGVNTQNGNLTIGTGTILLGTAGISNPFGIQIGNTDTAGGAAQITRIASIDGCARGGLTATHAALSVDSKSNNYVLCVDVLGNVGAGAFYGAGTGLTAIPGGQINSGSIPNSALTTPPLTQTCTTWSISDASGGGVTITSNGNQYYCKDGTRGTVWFDITYGSNASGVAASITLPFTCQSVSFAGNISRNSLATGLGIILNGTLMSFPSLLSAGTGGNANVTLSTGRFVGTGSCYTTS